MNGLAELAARAPAGATLVVFHRSVLNYLSAPRREEFAAVVRRLPGHWIANEGPAVLHHDRLPEPPGVTAYNVLALDGRPLGWTGPHGQSLYWFG